MTRTNAKKLLKGTTALAAALLLSGCGIPERVAGIGQAPELTRIEPGTICAETAAAVPVRRWQRVQWQ